MEDKQSKFGQLALEHCKVRLPIEVLQSHAGFYIGTVHDGMPCSRKASKDSWKSKPVAPAPTASIAKTEHPADDSDLWPDRA